MCGLGGIASTNMIDTEIEYARRLGILNMFRGEDSTGMFDYVPTLPEKERIHYWKSTAHPVDFIKNTFGPLRKARWEKKPTVIAIHCRAATQGKIIKANAHPFAFENLVGMHNGTITKDFPNRKKFGTDSEAIFYNINKFGLNKALEMVNDCEPAYALVWMNWKDQTLNFIRNPKRPLFYFHTYADQTVTWSSESDHILTAHTGQYGHRPVGTPKTFMPYIHYSLDISDPKNMKFKETEIPEAKEVTKKYSTGFQGQHHSSSTYTTYPSSIYRSPKETELDLPEYWLAYGKTASEKTSTHIRFDESSGCWFTDYSYSQLVRARGIVQRKLLERGTAASNTSTVVTFPKKQEGSTQNSTSIKAAAESAKIFMNDELPFDMSPTQAEPWGPHMVEDEDEEDPAEDVEDFFDTTLADETGKVFLHPFGPGFTKSCSTAAYQKKLSNGCSCCGNLSEVDDEIFWLDDNEYVCEDCTKDIAFHQSAHWLHTQGGLSEQTVDRLTTEYYTYVYNEPEHENTKASVH